MSQPSLQILSAMQASDDNLAQLPDEQFMNIFAKVDDQHQALRQTFYEEYKGLVQEYFRLAKRKHDVTRELLQLVASVIQQVHDSNRVGYTFFDDEKQDDNEEEASELQEVRTLLDQFQGVLDQEREVMDRGLQVQREMNKYYGLIRRMRRRARDLARNAMPGMKRKFKDMS